MKISPSNSLAVLSKRLVRGGHITINRRILYAIFGSELVFLGLVILVFTHVVSRGPLYWAVIGAIALSAWMGVILSRRLFPKGTPTGQNRSPTATSRDSDSKPPDSDS
jgi:hypothetical protein